MRFVGIKFASMIGVAAFAVANVWDYSVQRAAYFEKLKESGMTWAGAWFWGLPFGTFWSGAGLKGDEWGIHPVGLSVNLLLLVAFVMLLGVAIEKSLDRIRSARL